jgi:protein-L-isoaspartate(D-aspartate) O-methyltransferase
VTESSFAQTRAAMVESQLRTSDVNDTRVIAAMASVPREAFLPADKAAMAYIDRPVKLPGGRAINPPLATGRLLSEAAIKPGEKVLLIGAATGYAAALVRTIGAALTSVEEDAALAEQARAADSGVVVAPLCAGAPDGAPYDVIVIDGAVEDVPAALVDQLAEGGRLVTGQVDRGVTRLCIGRKAGGSFGLVRLADMEMVVLPGFSRPASFVF